MSEATRQFEFGEFRLDVGERRLSRPGVAVPLSPKAFDTLVVLVERAGRLVDKSELMQAVWPDAFVEEIGLARNISVLRKALNQDPDGVQYIETVPKRGYRFTAPVTAREGAPLVSARYLVRCRPLRRPSVRRGSRGARLPFPPRPCWRWSPAWPRSWRCGPAGFRRRASPRSRCYRSNASTLRTILNALASGWPIP